MNFDEHFGKLMTRSVVVDTLAKAFEVSEEYEFDPEWKIEIKKIIDGPKTGKFVVHLDHKSFWGL